MTATSVCRRDDRACPDPAVQRRLLDRSNLFGSAPRAPTFAGGNPAEPTGNVTPFPR